MDAATQYFQSLKTRQLLLALVMLIIGADGNTATNGEPTIYLAKHDRKHERYDLRPYRKQYRTEVYGFCIARYRAKERELRSCLRRQEKLRRKILRNALRKLGSQPLAQGIYNECLGYQRNEGVGRIGWCVKTRLAMDDILENNYIEKEIYDMCEFKWRKHGSAAIDTCSLIGATHYRDKGELRDR